MEERITGCIRQRKAQESEKQLNGIDRANVIKKSMCRMCIVSWRCWRIYVFMINLILIMLKGFKIFVVSDEMGVIDEMESYQIWLANDNKAFINKLCFLYNWSIHYHSKISLFRI